MHPDPYYGHYIRIVFWVHGFWQLFWNSFIQKPRYFVVKHTNSVLEAWKQKILYNGLISKSERYMFTHICTLQMLFCSTFCLFRISFEPCRRETFGGLCTWPFGRKGRKSKLFLTHFLNFLGLTVSLCRLSVSCRLERPKPNRLLAGKLLDPCNLTLCDKKGQEFKLAHVFMKVTKILLPRQCSKSK